MIRNLRVLGLAFVAVCAMSALTASSASAAEFTAANGEAQHLTTEDVPPADVFVASSGAELTCANEVFTAEAPKGKSTTLQFIPDYVNCKTVGSTFNNVTVTENGCTFTFTSHGHVKVDCPKETDKIEIHHFSNEAHTTSSCTNTVVPQDASGTVTYTNEKDGSVVAHGTLGVLQATHGPCSFGFTLNVESTYHLSTKVLTTTKNAIHVK